MSPLCVDCLLIRDLVHEMKFAPFLVMLTFVCSHRLHDLVRLLLARRLYLYVLYCLYVLYYLYLLY